MLKSYDTLSRKSSLQWLLTKELSRNGIISYCCCWLCTFSKGEYFCTTFSCNFCTYKKLTISWFSDVNKLVTWWLSIWEIGAEEYLNNLALYVYWQLFYISAKDFLMGVFNQQILVFCRIKLPTSLHWTNKLWYKALGLFKTSHVTCNSHSECLI